METDIVIVGAGPAGLCMARSLSGHRLNISVVEQQPLEEIQNPGFDGREIALTQKSVQILKTLGIWNLIAEDAKSPLLEARIFDGSSSVALSIGHESSAYPGLGWLVSNQLIRRAAHASLATAMGANGDITVLAGEKVTSVKAGEADVRVLLDSGCELAAKLVIAADGRFSPVRKMMGVATDTHDFGKTMLVCRMEHPEPHHHAAWQWFGHDQTVALLPMNPSVPGSGVYQSSVVVTLSAHEIDRLMGLPFSGFNLEMERRFGSRLGPMNLASARHCYPLVSVYPKRFVGLRFASIGDAAVGMHPVTAHGFNFGLFGADVLAQRIIAASATGSDIASPFLLKQYEDIQRRHTLPLYLATQFIARCYTENSFLARIARKALLHVGRNCQPFKRAIAASLAG